MLALETGGSKWCSRFENGGHRGRHGLVHFAAAEALDRGEVEGLHIHQRAKQAGIESIV